MRALEGSWELRKNKTQGTGRGRPELLFSVSLLLSTASTQQASVIDIQGLPFQAGAYVTLGGIAGIAQYGYQNGFYNSRQFSGLVIESGTSIRLYKRDDGSFLNGTDVNGGREFRMDFSYHAA